MGETENKQKASALKEQIKNALKMPQMAGLTGISQMVQTPKGLNDLADTIFKRAMESGDSIGTIINSIDSEFQSTSND